MIVKSFYTAIAVSRKKIVKYTTFKHWSKEFFDDFKKSLIPYFVKADEFDGIFRLR